MRLKIMNLYVNDQDRALRFYTEKLGFQKKTYISRHFRATFTHGICPDCTKIVDR